MDILKYNVEICQTCFMLRGYVIEKWNGRVEVVCACQIWGNDKEYLKSSRRMIAKVLAEGEVKFLWMPGSSIKDKTGDTWHVPLFSMGAGGVKGEPNDIKVLKNWLTTIPKEKLEL